MIGASTDISRGAPDRAALRASGALSLLSESLAVRGELQRAELLLGPALVEAVQLLIRAELHSHASLQPAEPDRWMTPPKAAKLVGIPVKEIYAGIHEGQIVPHLKNSCPTPKQPKYSVNVDEVIAYARRSGRRASPAEVQANISERASQILAERSAKNGR